jgi:hypothetical protein
MYSSQHVSTAILQEQVTVQETKYKHMQQVVY